MSISFRTRGRRPRVATAIIGSAALVLATAGIALADDVIVDNDVVQPGNQHSLDLTVAPGDPVSTSAQMVVDNQGSKHLTAGTPIVVGLDTSTTDFDGVSGVTVGDASGTVPTPWDSSSPHYTLSSAITFTAPTTPGVYNLVIKYVPTTFTCDAGDDKCLSSGSGDPFNINLTVQAPTSTNHAPTVAFSSPPTSTIEGTATTFTFSVSDEDAGDSWTFPTGYPDCGGGTVSNATSVPSTATTGSFDCTFPDGVDPNLPAEQKTVGVKVVDSASAASNTATTDVTVHNADPVVSTPSLSATSIDCRNSVTLSPISFSDLGLGDSPWAVDIDWNDGSSHTTYNALNQGAQVDATHTYNTPGTYRPTVTVTDKDGGSGTATSSNQVVVNHVYTTDFLPPFDDSSPSKLIVNTMKNGRTVPVKASIYDVCAGAYVTSPSVVTIRTNKVSAPTTAPNPDAVENYADAGASSANTNLFRWTSDSTVPGGGFWIYNLDSKALNLITNSYYRIDITVDGNQATKTDWAVLQPVK